MVKLLASRSSERWLADAWKPSNGEPVECANTIAGLHRFPTIEINVPSYDRRGRNRASYFNGATPRARQ
jgi:hypothetical protein